MRTRLAKKIARVPIDRLAPMWWSLAQGGGKDTKINEAIRILNRNNNK